MKNLLEKTQVKYYKFDQSPYIEDRLVCGINALIDVLKLKIAKLHTAERIQIQKKLVELSLYDYYPCSSLVSQSVYFQILLELYVEDDLNLLNDVFEICEKKFQHFLATCEYV